MTRIHKPSPARPRCATVKTMIATGLWTNQGPVVCPTWEIPAETELGGAWQLVQLIAAERVRHLLEYRRWKSVTKSHALPTGG